MSFRSVTQNNQTYVLMAAAGVALCFVLLGYLSVSAPVSLVSPAPPQLKAAQVASQYYVRLKALTLRLEPYLDQRLSQSDAEALQAMSDELMGWSVPAPERESHLALVVKLRALANSLTAAPVKSNSTNSTTAELQSELRAWLDLKPAAD